MSLETRVFNHDGTGVHGLVETEDLKRPDEF